MPSMMNCSPCTAAADSCYNPIPDELAPLLQQLTAAVIPSMMNWPLYCRSCQLLLLVNHLWWIGPSTAAAASCCNPIYDEMAAAAASCSYSYTIYEFAPLLPQLPAAITLSMMNWPHAIPPLKMTSPVCHPLCRPPGCPPSAECPQLYGHLRPSS